MSMKLRISSKMVAGFLLMAALLLAAGLVTIFYTYRLHRVSSALLTENIASLKAAQKLEVTLFRMRGFTLNYILDGDPRWLQDLEREREKFRTWLEKAKAATHVQEENTILQAIAQRFEDLEKNQQAIQISYRNGPSREAQSKFLSLSRETFDNIFERCDAFVSANENVVVADQGKIEHINETVRTTMYGFGLVGIILGGLLGVALSQSITKPIYELVLKARGVTGGEFIERFDLSTGGELEELDHHVHELISRINTANADLEKNRRLLARSDKLAALGKLAAGLAHEIRNPLAAIKMLIYSMRKDSTINEEKREEWSVILKEIDRMERFIHDFLEFARPPDPRFAPIDLNDTIRQTLNLLAPRLQESGAKIIEQLSADLDNIVADAGQIKQVVMNLVLNALEAMPNGGGLGIATARKTTAHGDNDNEWVQIRVADTGAGIPKEIFDNLFDPFVSGRQHGTGLGLSIAHQIVHQHHGWIEAIDNPEGGATFIVTLPAGKPSQSIQG